MLWKWFLIANNEHNLQKLKKWAREQIRYKLQDKYSNSRNNDI